MFPTSTFIPQIYGRIQSVAGFDRVGRPRFGPPRRVGISVIRNEQQSKTTSIRTDKSGSQGNADEVVVKGRLLLETHSNPKIGDLVSFMGETHRIDKVFPRLDMDGLINHYQVDIERWV